MDEASTRTCTLRLAAEGVVEQCPGGRCAFWDDGCLVDRLGPDVRRSDLAAYLLELRERLEQTRDLREAESAHSAFSRRIGREL
jgi:hypothetical protein